LPPCKPAVVLIELVVEMLPKPAASEPLASAPVPVTLA